MYYTQEQIDRANLKDLISFPNIHQKSERTNHHE